MRRFLLVGGWLTSVDVIAGARGVPPELSSSDSSLATAPPP
jgi:hypothetical protein